MKEIRDFIAKAEKFLNTAEQALNTGDDAYDKRLVGDYGVGFTVTEQQAKDLLKTAQDFVQKLKSYLKKWIETG